MNEVFEQRWARVTAAVTFALSLLGNLLTLSGAWDRFIAPLIWPPRATVNMVCKAIAYMTDEELLNQPERIDQALMLGDVGGMVRPGSEYAGKEHVFLNVLQGIQSFANFNFGYAPVYPIANPFIQCIVTNVSSNEKEARNVSIRFSVWSSPTNDVKYDVETIPVSLVPHDSMTFDIVNHSNHYLIVAVKTDSRERYEFSPQQCRFSLQWAWHSQWFDTKHPYKYKSNVPPPAQKIFPQAENCR